MAISPRPSWPPNYTNLIITAMDRAAAESANCRGKCPLRVRFC
jgi:hypothetical protein